MTRLWTWWGNVVAHWAEENAALPKPWPVFKEALVDYRNNWKLLIGVVSIVAIPVAILSNTIVDPASDTTLAAYMAVAQLIMNAAVVYAVVTLNSGKSARIRDAYYEGSAGFVRLILLSLALLIMLLPLIVGVAILVTGVIAPGTGLNPVEVLLLVLLAVVIAIPSVVLIVRSIWAIYVIFETKQGPLEAIGASRQLTRGRRLPLLGRLIGVGLLLIPCLLPVVGILLGINYVLHWTVVNILLGILLSIFVLPVSNLYLYRMYKGLA